MIQEKEIELMCDKYFRGAFYIEVLNHLFSDQEWHSTNEIKETLYYAFIKRGLRPFDSFYVLVKLKKNNSLEKKKEKSDSPKSGTGSMWLFRLKK